MCLCVRMCVFVWVCLSGSYAKYANTRTSKLASHSLRQAKMFDAVMRHISFQHNNMLKCVGGWVYLVPKRSTAHSHVALNRFRVAKSLRGQRIRCARTSAVRVIATSIPQTNTNTKITCTTVTTTPHLATTKQCNPVGRQLPWTGILSMWDVLNSSHVKVCRAHYYCAVCTMFFAWAAVASRYNRPCGHMRSMRFFLFRNVGGAFVLRAWTRLASTSRYWMQ